MHDLKFQSSPVKGALHFTYHNRVFGSIDTTNINLKMIYEVTIIIFVFSMRFSTALKRFYIVNQKKLRKILIPIFHN